MTTTIASYTKTAGAIKDYVIDWQARLSDYGDLLASATWSVSPPGIGIGAGAYAPTIAADGKSAAVWLSGGTPGVTYTVTCHGTTDNVPPREDDLSIAVTVEAGASAEPFYPGSGIFDVVRDYGAVGDGVTDDTAAIQAAIDDAEQSGGVVWFPPLEFCFTSLTVTANGVVLTGAGDMADTGAVLVKTTTTGDGVTVTAQNSGLRNLMIRNLSSGAAPTSGYAAKFDDCFAAILENVRIVDSYNGVRVEGSYEMRIQGTLWLRGLFGTVGLDVDGNSGFAQRVIADNPYYTGTEGKQHRARVAGAPIVAGDTYTNSGLIFQCTGAGTLDAGAGPAVVPGTTVANSRTTDVTDGTATVRFVGRLINWIRGGSTVAGFTVQTCAVLNGYRAFRQEGGNWWFFGHAEFDHQWSNAVSLATGSGFRTTSNFWLSSVFTSYGISIDATYSGDIDIPGGRIFGTADSGIILQPGPVEVRFDGITFDTCAGLSALLCGVTGSTGPRHFKFTNNLVKNCDRGVTFLGSPTDADWITIADNDFEDVAINGIAGTPTGNNISIHDNLDWEPRVRLTAQAANIGVTNLFPEAPCQGMYEADVEVIITTAGTAGTLVVTIAYTDDLGATSQATAGILITGTGRDRGRFLFRSTGAAQITRQVSGIVTPGALQYNLTINVRRI